MKQIGWHYVVVIVILGLCLVFYVDQQNKLAYLRMQIPKEKEEIQELLEEISALQYGIDQFESPAHLMDIAQNPEFRHLEHPTMRDILSMGEGYALQWDGSAH
ncbi:MAG: hypothetical protein AAGI90_04640 [Chlamydiota bacterium]